MFEGRRENKATFPKLSLPNTEIKDLYDVIVVGSGYGASIAASRCARAGQTVCVLEKGGEWLPGDFPESPLTAPDYFRVTCDGKEQPLGDKGLYDVIINDDITVVKGCGLGGTSLINANVYLEADPRVFKEPLWPNEIRQDMETMMSCDRKHFEQMMRPTVYPDNFPKLKKLDAMQKAAGGLVDIEDSFKVARKVPLFVNFDQEKTGSTKHRFDQPACNGCGNCCSGCNTGAKQTLNMNYLPDAKCYGAEIFTHVSVISVSKDPWDAALWRVHYERNDKKHRFFTEEQTVKAKYVILGAGSIGSTQILLQSKNSGLEISETIGTRFTGNGDALGFSFHGKEEVNSIGKETGKYPKVTDDSPGPCITSVIDLRKLPNKKLQDGMVIEDGTVPGAAFWAMLAASKVIDGLNLENVAIEPSTKWCRIFKSMKDPCLDKTLAYLAMSHDDSSGRITIHPKLKGPMIEWKGAGWQPIFQNISKRMKELTDELGGSYIANPIWSSKMHKGLVTVHPLGGCPVGEHGGVGVVNHKGQVFVGGSADVYHGLYVMDGSIIPMSVGVNPVCTISMLAERCCRLLIEDAGWEIDYDSFRNFSELQIEPRIGLKFSERMTGSLKEEQTNETSECTFNITILSPDVEKMLQSDPSHEAEVSGTLVCPLLSKETITISNGQFNLFEKSKDRHETREMNYNFSLVSSENKRYRFEGKKYIKSNYILESGLVDTTTLFVKVYDAESDNIFADGVLKIHLDDFMHQLHTIEVTNTKSGLLKAKWLERFIAFFAGTLFNTYCPLSKFVHTSRFASKRIRRKLKLNGVVPTVHKVTTEDNLHLSLTRFQGGERGPVLAIHGLGVSSEIFSHDTIPTNFVEYFVGHGFDVWLFDSRMSIANPEVSASNAHTLDDVIFYDYPAAVKKIIDVTKEKKVLVLAHCAGALTFWGSMATGLLNGMIDSVVFSQVTPVSKGTPINQLKGLLHVSNIVKFFGQKTISAHDLHAPSFFFYKSPNRCNNDVCHNISLMYGLLYEHCNLSVATHDALHELFGEASLKYFSHLSRCFGKGKLVDHEGDDVFFRGMNANGDLVKRMPWMENLNVPIFMFHGSKNQAYEKEGIERMDGFLREIHPKQHYEAQFFEGYGHIDGIIGKRAVRDVWPHLLAFFEKHSELAARTSAFQCMFDHFHMALGRIKEDHHSNLDNKSAIPGKKGSKVAALDEKDSASAYKVTPGHAGEDATDWGKSRDSDKPHKNSLTLYLISWQLPCLGTRLMLDTFFFKAQRRKCNRMQQMQQSALIANEMTQAKKADLERLKSLLSMAKINPWPTGRKKSRFHDKPRYVSRQGDLVVDVAIRDDQTDRRIVVLSDTHLGSSWTSDKITVLHEFITLLAKCAKRQLHTLVLLGDIFDMWGTPTEERPGSPEAMMKEWMSNEKFHDVVETVKRMADNNEVKVYYIPGNHDFEISSDLIAKMFGKNVKFVTERKLVLVIQTDHDQTYTVRFEHGHHHDLFNCTDFLINNRPIGYYVSRCQQSLEDCSMDTPSMLQFVATKLLEYTPTLIGGMFMQVLSHTSLQETLIKQIFETALERKTVDDNEVILQENNVDIKIGELTGYPLISAAVQKFGATHAYSMLRASMGFYDDILEKMDEDIIVFGHTHVSKNIASRDEIGEAIYANSGTWVDIAPEFSYVVLNPPTAKQEGSVEVPYESR